MKSGMSWLAAICAAGIVACVGDVLCGQGIEYTKAHYTKYEYRVPMRDGKKLFTSVYVPKDASPDKKYPILMTRTPYNVKPYGVDQYKPDLGPSPLFNKAGYIFVYQDVRGRWMSEGEFVNMRPYVVGKKQPTDVDDSSDAFDTIDWLLKNVPHHNGSVGQWGISYPGFYAAAAAIDAHPALKAVSPQAPVMDWFVGDDWHHNGALFLPHAFNFMSTFGRPRPEPTKKFEHKFEHETQDGYQFFLNLGPLANADARYFKGDVAFWNEVMRHGTYDDFWKSRNLRQHLKKIKPAVMTVGGWFDAENLFGALETYRSIEASSPGATNVIVMGPWVHGGWSRGDGASLGHVSFNAKTAEFYREHIELPFFEFHLKGVGTPKIPEAWMFETGTNQWRKWETWPPKESVARTMYLREGGTLSTEPPTATDERTARDEYVSDPAKPVPYLSFNSIAMATEYMVDDQRHAARRPDVLVYQSEVLDRDLTVVGPIQVKLFASTTGTDADFVVKLVDVYPDDYPNPEPNPTNVRMSGYQQLVRGDVMRGKFRDNYEKPAPFEPGKPVSVGLALPDVSHTFRSGHRIMVQVQSTWFPLVDRNPQTFVDIYTAKESDFQKATQSIYRTRDMSSRIELRTLP